MHMRRFMKWDLVTGITPVTFVVIDIIPPAGFEKELVSKAEEVAKRIDENVYVLLPKGGS